MAGKDNLRPAQSSEEARARGSKGGKASGIARRRKRDAMETAKIFLQLAAKGKLDQYLAELDVKENERTNLMGIIARHTLQAQGGNVNSARFVLETAGMVRKQGADSNVSVNVGGDGSEPVVIYLPENGRD